MRNLLVALALVLVTAVGCDDLNMDLSWLEDGVQPQTQVLAFGATWCGPCLANKPELQRLRNAGIDIQEIDVDQRPDLKQQYGVTSVPTYIVFNNGQEVQRTQDIRTLIRILRAVKKLREFPRL